MLDEQQSLLNKPKTQKLDQVIIFEEGPLKGVASVLIDRTEHKAIFERSDGIYDVFRIKVNDDGVEVYPSMADLGETYWRYFFNGDQNNVMMTAFRFFNIL